MSIKMADEIILHESWRYNSFVNTKVIKAMRILLFLNCRIFKVVTSMLTSMSWRWYLEKSLYENKQLG